MNHFDIPQLETIFFFEYQVVFSGISTNQHRQIRVKLGKSRTSLEHTNSPRNLSESNPRTAQVQIKLKTLFQSHNWRQVQGILSAKSR